MYTLEDLEDAKLAAEKYRDLFANYTGNNPNKYQSDIKAANRKVRHITEHLKEAGVLPYTEKEKLNKELDINFPNAQSKEVVQYKGKKYRKAFYPQEKTRSGNVKTWSSGWHLIENGEDK